MRRDNHSILTNESITYLKAVSSTVKKGSKIKSILIIVKFLE